MVRAIKSQRQLQYGTSNEILMKFIIENHIVEEKRNRTIYKNHKTPMQCYFYLKLTRRFIQSDVRRFIQSDVCSCEIKPCTSFHRTDCPKSMVLFLDHCKSRP